MNSNRNWCNTCRGPGEGANDLIRCNGCPRKFHVECCGKRNVVDDSWKCPFCIDEIASIKEYSNDGSSHDQKIKSVDMLAREVSTKVKKYHRAISIKTYMFFRRERKAFDRFLSQEKLDMFTNTSSGQHINDSSHITEAEGQLLIGPNESYIHATLRPYQV